MRQPPGKHHRLSNYAQYQRRKAMRAPIPVRDGTNPRTRAGLPPIEDLHHPWCADLRPIRRPCNCKGGRP